MIPLLYHLNQNKHTYTQKHDINSFTFQHSLNFLRFQDHATYNSRFAGKRKIEAYLQDWMNSKKCKKHWKIQGYLHFKTSKKRPPRNPAFISVSKNVIFQFFFWLFFFDWFPFFSARRKRTTFGTEGKGCQRWVVVKKEGRKTRRERKISGVFVFPPQAVTKALIFGFSYLFCYFYFYFLHLSG